MSERKSTKIKTNCLKCGKEMLVYPSDIEAGRGKFCGRPCRFEYIRVRIKINCLKCGKEVLVRPCKIKEGGGKFCSVSCRASFCGATHGLRQHPLYSVWCSLKQRCGNPNDAGYPDYGGRGITVCEEWRDSFVAFYAWATANGYAEDLQIDREKNDQGYSPGNCRFVTRSQNCLNRRRESGASSKYWGVSLVARRGRWRASYRHAKKPPHNGKLQHLGIFTTEEDAARAWDKEAIAQGRDPSTLNFPEEASASR